MNENKCSVKRNHQPDAKKGGTKQNRHKLGKTGDTLPGYLEREKKYKINTS